MQLFGSYTSPFVRHIRIVLAQMGLEFEFVETDYTASAEKSPAARVPFLLDGERMLTDSLSILRFLREKAGQPFFPDLDDFDRFLLVNAALDSTVNVFLLERDGVTPEDAPYLGRQQRRIGQCLNALDEAIEGDSPTLEGDFGVRLGCYLSWALFRERFDLGRLDHLARFQQRFESDPAIAATHPE